MSRTVLAVLVLAVYGQSWAGYEEGRSAFAARDYATALAEFLPLAEQGNTGAQCALGYMYKNGLGIPHDYQQALKWYRRAAEQGDAKAQNNLGLMYARGLGVAQDLVQAYVWYSIAWAYGSEPGGRNRERVMQKMTPAQIEQAEELVLEWVINHP